MSFSNLDSKPKKQQHPKKSFLDLHGKTVLKALYNARNTIRNKPEVKAQDISKTYYIDYLDYTAAIEDLLKKYPRYAQ